MAEKSLDLRIVIAGASDSSSSTVLTNTDVKNMTSPILDDVLNNLGSQINDAAGSGAGSLFDGVKGKISETVVVELLGKINEEEKSEIAATGSSNIREKVLVSISVLAFFASILMAIFAKNVQRETITPLIAAGSFWIAYVINLGLKWLMNFMDSTGGLLKQCSGKLKALSVLNSAQLYVSPITAVFLLMNNDLSAENQTEIKTCFGAFTGSLILPYLYMLKRKCSKAEPAQVIVVSPAVPAVQEPSVTPAIVS